MCSLKVVSKDNVKLMRFERSASFVGLKEKSFMPNGSLFFLY